MDLQIFFTEKFPELKGKDKETQIAILEEWRPADAGNSSGNGKNSKRISS